MLWLRSVLFLSRPREGWPHHHGGTFSGFALHSSFYAELSHLKQFSEYSRNSRFHLGFEPLTSGPWAIWIATGEHGVCRRTCRTEVPQYVQGQIPGRASQIRSPAEVDDLRQCCTLKESITVGMFCQLNIFRRQSYTMMGGAQALGDSSETNEPSWICH